ncbi:molybdopterin-dependent oxidoreductase [Thermodesulfobacteriota bacterium]
MGDRPQVKKTHCARMDHGGCAILAEVLGNKIVRIKGDPEGFLNRGYLCPKGLASPERLNHPDRLTYPLKRIGGRGEGKWERISWQAALENITENFEKIRREFGPEAVAFCQGMPKGLEHFALIRLANTFGSPNVVAVQDVCHAPREISGLHTCGFYPVTDFHHQSRLVLLWGSNITSTNEEGEICSLLLKQLKKGAELMVVDPRRTVLAKKAALWLQLRPGTDHALALAFLNVIIEEGLFNESFVEEWTYGFDELAAHVAQYTPESMSEITWVPPDLIRKGARLYAKSHPAALHWGNAIEHQIHAFDTTRSLLCMMALCGNLDIAGGNIHANEPDILPLGAFVKAEALPSKRKLMIHAHHHVIPKLMTVPPTFFKRAVLEADPYPVKGAYIQCANPLLSYADSNQTLQALMRLDFFVAADIFMTPTTSLADIVLPAATHFEFNDIGHYGLGHGMILACPQLVDPPPECWPDLKILNELGKALTPGEYWHEEYEGLLEELLNPGGLDYSQFASRGYLKGPDQFRKYLSQGFKTPTGKVELVLSAAKKLGVSPLPRYRGLPEEGLVDYPLVLTSSKSRYYLHSSYRWAKKLRGYQPQPRVLIHPQTAAEKGIREGDRVMIDTPKGSIFQVAHLSQAVHPEVIHASHGWWYPEGTAASLYGWDQSNINILTSANPLGREFGTPNLRGIGCRINPAPQCK